MKKIFALIIASCFLTACTTAIYSNVMPTEKKYKIDSVCIDAVPDTSVETKFAIKNNLIIRGVRLFDYSSNNGCPAEIIVSVHDTWHWDIAMYLKDLEIQFYDSKTNALVADGNFKTTGFHAWPSPQKVVDKVLSAMFEKLRAAGRLTTASN